MWLEQKYISLLSSRLLLFKPKGRFSYHFRCPICGDSAKNKFKTRGTFYQRKGTYFFGCFNCGASMRFTNFLKTFDKGLYEAYLVEKIGAPRNKPKHQEVPDEVFGIDMGRAARNAFLGSLLRLDGASDDNPAKAYVLKRGIPRKWLSELYYIDNFLEWTNSQLPNKYEHVDRDEPRLLIPMFDQEGGMIGFQSRVLGDAGARLRYLTAILRPEFPKLWGLNHVNFAEDYFVLEGPLDAMFLSNALATCGGKISSEILKLKQDGKLERSITVYDNEPRNTDVVKNLWKAVRNNYRVVIWPHSLIEKDINDMKIMFPSLNIEVVMRERTFQGLSAEQEFRLWNLSGWKPN